MNVNVVTGPTGPVPIDPKAQAEEKEYYRNEDLKDHLHTLFKWFMYVAFILLMVVFVIRVSHLITPSCWHWLTQEEIQNIDKIFFSGAIGSMLGRYVSSKIKT